MKILFWWLYVVRLFSPFFFFFSFKMVINFYFKVFFLCIRVIVWIFFILMMAEFSSTISLSFYFECDVSSGFLGTFPFSAFNHFQKFPLPEEYCAVNGRMWPRGARSLQNISKSCLTLAWLEKVVWAAGGAGSVASWRDERARESGKAHRLAGDTRWRMEGGEHQKRILLVLSALMKVCFIFSPFFLYVYVFVFVCVIFAWMSSVPAGCCRSRCVYLWICFLFIVCVSGCEHFSVLCICMWVRARASCTLWPRHEVQPPVAPPG